MKDVEIVYDADCPNVEAVRDQLRRALEDSHLPAGWREWIRGAVGNPPRVERFGSPTILVDGIDVAADSVVDGATCRLYANDEGGVRGVPSLQTIVSALANVHKERGIVRATATQLAATIGTVEGGLLAFPTTVRLLANGKPVGIERLAGELGWAVERLEALLKRFPNVERDSAGALVGFGLTLQPTPHAFEVEGKQLFTWCAFDALFLPAILERSARVSSPCAASGTLVRLRVTPTEIGELEPADAVISLVVPRRVETIRESFCGMVSFVASEKVAAQWLQAHPEATAVPVAEAFTMARDFARQVLGASQSAAGPPPGSSLR
jgi:alkylmercury lyase